MADFLVTLQREQSEEKAKEAEDMIHKLKKQKMVGGTGSECMSCDVRKLVFRVSDQV